MKPLRLGILASHGGSTLQAVIDACANEQINARVVLVISNNSQSQALERAAEATIANVHLSGTTHKSAVLLDEAIADTLETANVDLVVLCGYMKKLGEQTLARFKGRLINTHPALLPNHGGEGFYGRTVHEAVLGAGDKESGATVHEVDAIYDTGKILAQARVPVLTEDTVEALEERVKAVEKELLVSTLVKLAGSLPRGS